MNSNELKTRDQIDKKYKWNIEAMISDDSAVDGDLDRIAERAEEYNRTYSGKLAESAAGLLKAHKDRDAIWMDLERIFVSQKFPQRWHFSHRNCSLHLKKLSSAI